MFTLLLLDFALSVRNAKLSSRNATRLCFRYSTLLWLLDFALATKVSSEQIHLSTWLLDFALKPQKFETVVNNGYSTLLSLLDFALATRLCSKTSEMRKCRKKMATRLLLGFALSVRNAKLSSKMATRQVNLLFQKRALLDR